MASGLSKILVFGGTGYLGKYIVKASIKMGHPTFVYGRPITPNTKPSKVELHKEFQSMGGELSEHEKLVSIIKQIDVVIFVLGAPLLLEQLKIIDALKIAGNVKRFIPSDFAVLTCEEDIATYTIKVANGSRTCNRIVFYRPPRNIVSQLDLKVYVSEEEIVKLSEKCEWILFTASEHPHNVRAAILHSIFVKGGMTNFELSEDDLEVSKLYPDFDYTTVDHLFDVFLANAPNFEHAAL
ncbi:hypothetical protein ACSBR1_017726 [Camellia fascicularis]